VVGDIRRVSKETFELMDGVDSVMRISRPYKITSREFQPENTIFNVNGVKVGSDEILIIAGPCSVESREQLLESAQAVKEAGGHALRGGAFKPRTSPYAFQGMGEAGLELLAEARETDRPAGRDRGHGPRTG
jgi:3-deoxy-7-phosphoheptulonate synthase